MQPRIALTLVVAVFVGCGGGSSGPDAVPTGACNDGADNDGDHLTDFPADPGCDSASDADESNVPIAQCADHRDNDADGREDYPNDPGCFSQLDNDETDGCPDGADCPVCSNGMDDDGDSLTDYPMDQGCASAADDDEYVTNPAACGPGLIVTRLQDASATGAFIPGTSVLTGSCGGATGTEVAYELVIETPTVIVASTDNPTTTSDTVMYLRGDCMQPTSELACNDDIDAANHKSTITASVPPGTYYLIVDNKVAGAGNFLLKVDLLAGEGVPCGDTSECGPGLICRIPSGMTEMVCSQPVCNDGLDDDSDGTPDYPGDPGCTSPDDADETDDCPSGPTCPQCANGIDDDGDTQIDYPADTDCQSASQNAEGCPTEHDPFLTLMNATETGDLTGSTDDFALTCGSGGLGDRVYLVTVPAMQSMTFDTCGTSYDTELAWYGLDCVTALSCNDDSCGLQSSLPLTNVAAGTYALVVAQYGAGTGPYSLHTTGVIAPLGACDGPLFTAGAFTCAAGYTCNGTICAAGACGNGTDDDGDGKVDYPDDPGCTSGLDTDETDDCPSGPMCPQCANGLDDDSDTLIDYPADTGCQSAASDSELGCTTETDPFLTLTMPTQTGDLTGAANDFPLACGAAGGADKTYLVTLPHLQTITFDMCTTVFDTVLALYGTDCVTSVGCDDDSTACGLQSQLTLTDLAAGTYALVTAAYSSGTGGPYTLHTTGVIAPNGACTSPLFTSGALTCATGTTCTAGTCQ